MKRLAQNNRGRAMLVGLRSLASKVGLKPSDVRPHELHIYSELTANSDTLIFNISSRKGSYVMERLLDENDAFYAHEMAIGVHPVKVAGGIEYPGNSVVQYFADPNIFDGPVPGGAVATEAEAIEMLFNADLKIETEQDIRVKNYAARRFRTALQTQASATTVAQTEGKEMKDLYTNLGFFGGNTQTLELKYKSGSGDYTAIPGTVARKNYAVLILSGFIIVGGSKKVTAGRMHQALGR